MNGDGKLDVIVERQEHIAYSNQLQVLFGNGDGTLQPPGDLQFPLGISFGLAAGDFNGDGRVDLAGSGPDQSTASSVVQIFLGVLVPSLRVSATHVGGTSQGQTGATFSISVSNSPGTAPTNGMVTITEWPNGNMLSTAMFGMGWFCSGTVCSRSDTLAPGSSYPPITVTMNVSTTAPSPMINFLTASGGGSLTNEGPDPIVVLPSGPGTHLLVAAPPSATVGVPIQFTVTALDANNNGTTQLTDPVHFTSTDSLAVLPPDATLSGGVGTFSAMLATAGVQTVTATDALKASINGTSPSIMVSATKTSLFLSQNTLNFNAGGGTVTDPQSFTISFGGGAKANWTAVSSQPNVIVTPSSGIGTTTVRVTASAGPSAVVTVTAPGATNSPQQIQINVANATVGFPYGSFDTPVNNTTGITGSIAVTGWALDSIEVTKVDIWREPVPGEAAQSGGLVYIGDAVFVVGSRPDVETAHPNAPFNYRAGWGYLMLTTGLPNNGGSPGNGTYKLHAIAHNKTGASLDLGTRAITVDNAHSVKPFGAIDTPGQGGTISGTAYVNFGWVLTPQPCSVPTDGSTIWVTVDGQNLGHPVYNNYRSDIATGLPGYANSNGAVGYFYLDTTQFANGVHTMGWLATDSCARTDGMGSRFIDVEN